jgi:hypothetical protein
VDARMKTFQLMMTSARRFQIPEFQRPYCWSLDEVEQLWTDVTGAYQDFVDKGRPIQSEEYFLGPIVSANARDNRGTTAHVVDGQQCLTTLHSLLWCAYGLLCGTNDTDAAEKRLELERLLLTPRGETTLAVARDDQADFQALREGTPLNEKRELGQTGKFLRGRLSRMTSDGNLVDFLHYLENQVTFVHVETEDFASAWDLFIGLNGKGRPLTPADLIKAFVCGTSTDAQAMADIWQDKVLPLGGDSTSAILETVRAATGELGSDAKLFKLFERAWRSKEVTSPLLADGAQHYSLLWLAPLVNVPDLGEGKRSLRGLRTLARRDHSSVMIALAARFGARSAFDPKLVRAFESFQLGMAIRGLRGRERQFTELAHRIYRGDETWVDCLKALHALLIRLAPPIEDVRASIQNLRFPSRVMKFIVLQYEEGMRGDVEVGEVHYEHMMPQEPTSFWFQAAATTDRATYDRLVNSIGNIVPLDANTNIVGRNDDWRTKSDLYLTNVPTWTAAQLARNNQDSWTQEKIHLRAHQIAEWALSTRWSLARHLEQLVR